MFGLSCSLADTPWSEKETFCREVKRNSTSLIQQITNLRRNMKQFVIQKYKSRHMLLLFSVLAPCDVETGWRAFNYSCYKYFTNELNWTEATTVCEELNGSLVSLNSLEEYEFLYTDILPDKYKVWIGLFDVTFSWIEPRWVDGSVLAYEKWGLDQPNGRIGSECVTALNGKHFKQQWNHEWNDRACARLYPFVCETKQNQPF